MSKSVLSLIAAGGLAMGYLGCRLGLFGKNPPLVLHETDVVKYHGISNQNYFFFNKTEYWTFYHYIGRNTPPVFSTTNIYIRPVDVYKRTANGFIRVDESTGGWK